MARGVSGASPCDANVGQPFWLSDGGNVRQAFLPVTISLAPRQPKWLSYVGAASLRDAPFWLPVCFNTWRLKSPVRAPRLGAGLSATEVAAPPRHPTNVGQPFWLSGDANVGQAFLPVTISPTTGRNACPTLPHDRQECLSYVRPTFALRLLRVAPVPSFAPKRQQQHSRATEQRIRARFGGD
jgi:hypothetical protein